MFRSISKEQIHPPAMLRDGFAFIFFTKRNVCSIMKNRTNVPVEGVLR